MGFVFDLDQDWSAILVQVLLFFWRGYHLAVLGVSSRVNEGLVHAGRAQTYY